jgi:CubicO group peptidase (beta-lactamase class C family)
MKTSLWRAAAGAALAAGLAACAVAPAGSPAGLSQADAARFERLSAQLDAYVAAGRLPGGVAQVTRDGEVIYEDAFGWRDIDEQEPMTPDTIFRIASQSKAIVTVAALILPARMGRDVGRSRPRRRGLRRGPRDAADHHP